MSGRSAGVRQHQLPIGVYTGVIAERIAPARKDRPVLFDLPKLEKAAYAVNATAAIAEAVAAGELTPTEASELSKVVDAFARAVEIHDFELRLSCLEQNRERSGTGRTSERARKS